MEVVKMFCSHPDSQFDHRLHQHTFGAHGKVEKHQFFRTAEKMEKKD